MNPTDLAISVRGLSKSYVIAHNQERHITLAETLLHRLKHPLAKLNRETFWALNGISFDVRKGDVVGIIGRNGAGKSTLLKILSRITEPTGGEINLYGRVGSLLEVGTGFHTELTGRENIFLNGAILGMSKGEIRRQFDAIVDFAGVENFLDTPVKRYSSGMYVRLAFSVAAHLNPEILIVDEVLAVGDAQFQKKCLGKMKDVATGGRTVLFVSHQLQTVRGLCTRGIVMEKGKIHFSGSVDEALRIYIEGIESAAAAGEPVSRRGTGEVRVRRCQPAKKTFQPADDKEFLITLENPSGYDSPVFLSVLIKDSLGNDLLHCDSRLIGQTYKINRSQEVRFVLHSPWLRQGDYRMDIAVCTLGGILDFTENICPFSVGDLLPWPAVSTVRPIGVVLADFDLSVQDSTPQAKFSIEASNA